MTLSDRKAHETLHWPGSSSVRRKASALADVVERAVFRRARQVARSVELVYAASPALTIAHAALTFALGALPVVNLYLFKLIIDALSAKGAAADWNFATWLLAAAALVAALTDWLRALDVYVGEAQSRRATDHVHDLLDRQSLRLDLSYYENPAFHDNFHRAQTEAPHRPTLIVNHLVNALQGAVSLAGIVILLVAFQWKLTMWVFAAMLPILALRMKDAGFQHARWRNQTARQRLAHYLSRLVTHREHAKEVRLFDLGPYLRQRLVRLRESLRDEQRAVARHRAMGEGLTQSCASLATYGALAFLAHQIATDAIALGELVVYYQALQRGQTILRDLFANAAGLVENSLFLSNFYDFLGLEPAVEEPTTPRSVSYPLKRGICFENVAFDYPHGKNRAIDGLDLTIRAGEKIAIVGRNGAGKTTLIKLLCRLHDPTRGRITIDGTDLRDVSSAQWRKQIAAVFQDFGRYEFSARENIALGDLSALETHGRIERAAEAAGVARMIEKLPRGYDTPLGTLSMDGQDLSLGQWQKIAIARATLRSASILVFDEPTSALDPTSEAALLEKFLEMAEDRTAILISHRLSTVCVADRIVVIDEGVVKEAGTHRDLMRLEGLYAGMFRAQADRYRVE